MYIRFILKTKALIALKKLSTKSSLSSIARLMESEIRTCEKYNTKLIAEGRKYLMSHPITWIGKALYSSAIPIYEETFWKKAIEREGTLINNMEPYKESLMKRIAAIKTISISTKFVPFLFDEC
mmetsp:Transcript_23100/g.26480  ORF Transcript_23100/g.26480 Transcript_23100/m.26480 type:complete len:124 (-) Transcript_23100:42-413(-)